MTERLLAVSLPADADLRWHPVWQQLREFLHDEAGDAAPPTRLRRAVRGEEASELLPWTLDTRVTEVEPPPPPRPLWTVPAGLLREREQSSASSLEDRLACPLKWTLHYQARLRPSAAAKIPDDFQLRGTFCHEVLAEVFGMPGPCPTADTAVAAVLRTFDERVALDAAPLAQPARLLDRQAVRDQLVNSTRVLVDALERGGYTLGGTEVEVKGTIGGRGLRGSIDCLAKGPDASEAVLDFKYGGRNKYPVLLKEGRAVQLATYAEARRQEAGGADVRAAYLVLADAMLVTPEGSPLLGDMRRALVDGAPSVQDTWRAFVVALEAADGWLRGEEPIPARPLQEPDDWPDGVNLVLDATEDLPSVCRFCDYGVLCGREVLE